MKRRKQKVALLKKMKREQMRYIFIWFYIVLSSKLNYIVLQGVRYITKTLGMGVGFSIVSGR